MEYNTALEVIATNLDHQTREAVLAVIQRHHDEVLASFKKEERTDMLRWHQAAMNLCDEISNSILKAKVVNDLVKKQRENRQKQINGL